MLDPSAVDLAEIANALSGQTDYEHHRLINPGTGEIPFWTADTGIDGQTPVDLEELDLVVLLCRLERLRRGAAAARPGCRIPAGRVSGGPRSPDR